MRDVRGGRPALRSNGTLRKVSSSASECEQPARSKNDELVQAKSSLACHPHDNVACSKTKLEPQWDPIRENETGSNLRLHWEKQQYDYVLTIKHN